MVMRRRMRERKSFVQYAMAKKLMDVRAKKIMSGEMNINVIIRSVKKNRQKKRKTSVKR